ncbi:MAG: hypothetical protein JXA71_00750 [Chitinispirillaceae bacterium]|nr:hypothetical protein [Chitinispirillaceae bacterium]
MIRYIHLNPVRAGICKTLKELDSFPWTGHSILSGSRSWNIQDTRDVLARFGRSHEKAVVDYRRFLEKGIGNESELFEVIRNSNRQRESHYQPGCWVIGNREFVSRALAADNERKVRLARYAKERVSLDDIAEKVSERYGLVKGEIKKRSRNGRRSQARKVFSFICNRQYHYSVIAISRYLGISSPSVSVMISLGETYAMDPRL